VGREATLTIARGARRLLIKAGTDVIRVNTDRHALDDAGLERYLVHEDGFMRVPVLILGDVLVRGYTEELYAEALGPPAAGS
jgi:arsenate reductase-like glutaredoxin family protein